MGGNANSAPAKRRLTFGRIYRRLNQPFSVTVLGAVLVLIISTFAQQRYWLSQQHFLIEQSWIKQSIESNKSSEEEVAKVVGRVLAASALIVADHEQSVGAQQYEETRKQYVALQREWSVASLPLKLKMQGFSSDEIQKKWKAILGELNDLDDEIDKLHEFDADKPCAQHKQQISKCLELIEHIQESVGMMTQMMSKYTADRIQKH